MVSFCLRRWTHGRTETLATSLGRFWSVSCWVISRSCTANRWPQNPHIPIRGQLIPADSRRAPSRNLCGCGLGPLCQIRRGAAGALIRGFHARSEGHSCSSRHLVSCCSAWTDTMRCQTSDHSAESHSTCRRQIGAHLEHLHLLSAHQCPGREGTTTKTKSDGQKPRPRLSTVRSAHRCLPIAFRYT